MVKTRKIILILSLISIYSYSQNNGLKNFHTNLKYNSVYTIDLDTQKSDFLNYFDTNIIFDINENGSGKIIIYYQTKLLFFIKKNYKVNYSSGSGTYFFVTDNGSILRLGVSPYNDPGAFSLVLKNNTTITFTNK